MWLLLLPPTSHPTLQDLVADEIAPGLQLSAMLADILEDASSLHSLSLAGEAASHSCQPFPTVSPSQRVLWDGFHFKQAALRK